MTKLIVNEWFNQWIGLLKGCRKPKTITNYKNYYQYYISPVIGHMDICDVRPMHCSKVLQQMSENHMNSSVKQTKVAMRCLFQYAVENDIITKNPVGRTVIVPTEMLQNSESTERSLFISDSDLCKFFSQAKNSIYSLPLRLILETGLRASELIGLTWDEIDFDNRLINIRHTLQYESSGGWYFITPKSRQGSREIYMTGNCFKILQMLYSAKEHRPKPENPLFNNVIFLSKLGNPIRTSSYNIAIRKFCKDAGIAPFSLHSLRHTFASRCIMAGISPKVLQLIMGHSDISTTMNIYVHVSRKSKLREMEKLTTFEASDDSSLFCEKD